MENPSVSVVVPMYKVEQYIKICVDSILAQTFQDFEIILVDDASPDNCAEICRKFYGDNSKVKLIRHEKNLGLGPARNTGIKNSRGKYIYFVDSDDFILPNALEKFFNTAESSNADVVHAAGWYELFQNEPLPIRRENLQLKWDNYSREGFLPPNPVYRIEQLWKPYNMWSMAWLCFCRRDFLEKNRLEFPPILSEDEPFSFALLCFAEKYYIMHEAIYVYRRRAGSIMLTKSTERFAKGIQSSLIGSIYMQNLLDRLPRAEGYEQWCESVLEKLLFRLTSNHTLLYYDKSPLNKELSVIVDNALKNIFGNLTPFVKYFFNSCHIYRRQAEILAQQAETIAQNMNQIHAQIISTFNRIELSERKIVFVNFLGKGYGCNPKYIAEEILRQNLNLDMVWLVNDLNEPMPQKIRKVLYGSVDSMYELASAKVIVTNVKNLLPFPNKKRGQFLIMTWHGGIGGIKAIEKEAEEKLSPDYVRESKLNSQMTDLMMAGTQMQFEQFKRVMYYDGEILKCGVPRDDIFFRHDAELIARVRNSLNVPPENKIVMYAPTFRNDPRVMADACKFDAEKLLDALQKKFGGEWTLLMRFHPNNAAQFQNIFYSDKIINATAYPDMQELTLISDVVISDYSNALLEAMLCNKPVFIFAKDYDSYTKEREFLPLYFELPYKINRSESELFADIENFDAAAQEPKIKHFLDMVQPFDNGHASEVVVDRIKSVVIGNTPPLNRFDNPTDIEAFEYVRDKYSTFRDELPTYQRESSGTPKIFWWCWLQGLENAPPLCKLCLKSLYRNYPDYEIRIVTLKNISQFVNFPEHIVQKFNEGKISPTHFSDLIRLELLINYGGTWIDSTVLSTGRTRDYLHLPLFIFRKVWGNKFDAHLGSNWFIVAEKGHPILKTTRDLLYKFWQDHDVLGNGGFYFVFHCMFRLAAEKYPDDWAKVPSFPNVNPHLLQFEFFAQYAPDRFEQIKRMSDFHKLTWKYPPEMLTSEKISGTNYDYLMKFLS